MRYSNEIICRVDYSNVGVGCLGVFAGMGVIFEQLDSGGVLLFYALGGDLYLKGLPLLTAQPPHC